MIRFASFTVAALLLPCVPGARQEGQDSVPRKETVQAKEINDPDASIALSSPLSGPSASVGQSALSSSRRRSPAR